MSDLIEDLQLRTRLPVPGQHIDFDEITRAFVESIEPLRQLADLASGYVTTRDASPGSPAHRYSIGWSACRCSAACRSHPLTGAAANLRRCAFAAEMINQKMRITFSSIRLTAAPERPYSGSFETSDY
jgi:hypothetical protein